MTIASISLRFASAAFCRPLTILSATSVRRFRSFCSFSTVISEGQPSVSIIRRPLSTTLALPTIRVQPYLARILTSRRSLTTATSTKRWHILALQSLMRRLLRGQRLSIAARSLRELFSLYYQCEGYINGYAAALVDSAEDG